MIFQGGLAGDLKPWGEDEERECRFVFIGRNLDHELLKEGFLDCKIEEGDELRFLLWDKGREEWNVEETTSVLCTCRSAPQNLHEMSHSTDENLPSLTEPVM